MIGGVWRRIWGLGCVIFAIALAQGCGAPRLEYAIAAARLSSAATKSIIDPRYRHPANKALVKAVEERSVSGAMNALDAGACPNAFGSDSDAATIIAQAAASGDAEMVSLLIERGADPDVPDADGLTPLAMAARGGHIAVMEMLIAKGAGVNGPFHPTWTPLFQAVTWGHVEAAKLLLARGADPDKRVAVGLSPLECADVHSGGAAMVAVLIEGGADVNARGTQGHTPLMFALFNGNGKAAVALLKAGADAKKRVRYPLFMLFTGSVTTLHLAAAYCDEDTAAAIIDAGVDVDAKGSTRGWFGYYERIAPLRGWTALHVAAYRDKPATVEMLCERGARMDATDSDGLTPLDVAQKYGSKSAITVLEAQMRAKDSALPVTGRD